MPASTVYIELYGVTVALGVHTLLNSQVIETIIPGVSSKSIDNTTLASLFDQSVASVVRKIDDLTMTVEFDPTKDYAGAVGAVNESITLTLPKLVSASVSGAKFTYFGRLDKVDNVTVKVGDKPHLKLTYKINGYGALGVSTTPLTPEL